MLTKAVFIWSKYSQTSFEMILMYWFAVQETFIFIENSCAA